MGWNYLSIPIFQRCNCWSLWMDKQFHPTLYWVCDYIFMMGLQLIHLSKRAPRKHNADGKPLYFSVEFLSIPMIWNDMFCQPNHVVQEDWRKGAFVSDNLLISICFHCSLLLGVRWMKNHHCFNNSLVPTRIYLYHCGRRQTFYVKPWSPGYTMHVYSTRGGGCCDLMVLMSAAIIGSLHLPLVTESATGN